MKIEDVKVGQKVRMTYVEDWMERYLPGIDVGMVLTVSSNDGRDFQVEESEHLYIDPNWAEPVEEAPTLICPKGLKWRQATPEDDGKFGFACNMNISGYMDNPSHVNLEGELSVSDGKWTIPSRWDTKYEHAFVPVDKIVEHGGEYYKIATKEDAGKLGYFYDYEDGVGHAIHIQRDPCQISLVGDYFAMGDSRVPFKFAFIPIDKLKEAAKIEEPKEAKLPEVEEEVMELKSGQKVLITKPKVLEQEGQLTWISPNMDHLDGSIQTMGTVGANSSYVSDWWLGNKWLTPLVETNGRYFRKATKDDIGKQCYFTDNTKEEHVKVSLVDGRDQYTLDEINSTGRVRDCDGVPWAAAYVEVFDKKPLDKEETPVKVEEKQEETKQGDQKVREFKVGQKVRIHRPDNVVAGPGWNIAMNDLVGGVYPIQKVWDSGRLKIQDWSFLPSWVTLVEDLTESQDDVKVVPTKVEDSKETFEVKFNGQSLGDTTEEPTYGVPTHFRDPNVTHNPQLLTWTFQESKPFPKQTYHISKEILEDTINPAEKSAKPPKKERPVMALLAFASKTVRNASWSLLDWMLITPTKNTLRPVGKLVQYGTCYALIGTMVYCGWSLYQNPSWVFEKVSEMSPITIQFKGDPANPPAEVAE